MKRHPLLSAVAFLSLVTLPSWAHDSEGSPSDALVTLSDTEPSQEDRTPSAPKNDLQIPSERSPYSPRFVIAADLFYTLITFMPLIAGGKVPPLGGEVQIQWTDYFYNSLGILVFIPSLTLFDVGLGGSFPLGVVDQQMFFLSLSTVFGIATGNDLILFLHPTGTSLKSGPYAGVRGGIRIMFKDSLGVDFIEATFGAMRLLSTDAVGPIIKLLWGLGF